MKFLAIQAKKIGASRKSLYSSTKFLKTAVSTEDWVEPYPGASWAPSEMMSEGLTLNTGGVGRGALGFLFSVWKETWGFQGKMSDEPVQRFLCLQELTALLLSVLVKVAQSLWKLLCGQVLWCKSIYFTFSENPNRRRLCPLVSARGRERCSPCWP